MSDQEIERLVTPAIFRLVADQANDAGDHDELHAAAEVLQSDAIWATSNPYVMRWLLGLKKRYGIEGEL